MVVQGWKLLGGPPYPDVANVGYAVSPGHERHIGLSFLPEQRQGGGSLGLAPSCSFVLVSANGLQTLIPEHPSGPWPSALPLHRGRTEPCISCFQ